ncbi:NAD(P)H-dependent oxidoreductase [Dyella silvatica]|uniref:NAD(P)H-dependent oxidoreductase n=1 Tax=Dyella silvatica TaxID=2992128 RepID=UPI002255BD10|nr:NAD(P)H-dependent oxidoreductase [Dyella silvatica]
MKCLLVLAHPLHDSLAASLAQHVHDLLKAGGHEVVLEDLYKNAFDPALSASERASYYAPAYDDTHVAAEIQRLRHADAIVLVFPTWWFGFPAILKGWFDRVWAPGVAYDHAADGGAIKARLSGLRRMLVVTTLGSPSWVDRWVMRRPVRRILKTAILGACAAQCRMQMLSLYQSERVTAKQVTRFRQGIARALASW